MGEWIEYPKNKPTEMTVALVYNSKGWLFNEKAIYFPRDDTWVLQNPQMVTSLTLEITHYFPVSPYPEDKI